MKRTKTRKVTFSWYFVLFKVMKGKFELTRKNYE